MLKATEKILTTELKGHLIREIDLPYLFDGTASRRYGLINKLLKKNEWIQLRRGLYQLAAPYLDELPSRYYLANQLVPYSFVTAESALHFHGWIPEHVQTVTSVSANGRNKQFENHYGVFTYYVPPIARQNFFVGVLREQVSKKQYAFIATPLRALMDYVYWHKIDNADRDFLANSLRIDEAYIATLTPKKIKVLASIYHSKRVVRFLKNLLED